MDCSSLIIMRFNWSDSSLAVFEAQGYVVVLVTGGGKTVRAWRECPHLRIEIWGTRFGGEG